MRSLVNTFFGSVIIRVSSISAIVRKSVRLPSGECCTFYYIEPRLNKIIIVSDSVISRPCVDSSGIVEIYRFETRLN